MIEPQKNCPCCNKPILVMVSQCDGCGYDYQIPHLPLQTQTQYTQSNLLRPQPALPKRLALLTFAPPTVVLLPSLSVEEETSVYKVTEKQTERHTLPILLGVLSMVAVLLLVAVGVAIQTRRHRPGPEAQALAGHMKRYERASGKQFTALFGLPTTQNVGTVQGTPVDYWNYQCSDGSAFVMVNVRSHRVEQVSAVGPGS